VSVRERPPAIALEHGQVLEIVEMRATLEGLNARLAAVRHSKAQIEELEAILDEGMRIAGDGDPVELARLNEAFHGALAEMADNPVLREIVRTLRERTALIFAPLNRNRGKQIWEEHAAIMRAVIAGNAELARFLALHHVYSAANMQPRS
jgi:DNA-binding GntR family transcriptional regulator